MYDLIRSYGSRTLEKGVATGQTVTKEGLVVVSVLEAGAEKVQVSAGNGTERPVGFSTSDNQSIDNAPLVQTAVIPATPFIVTLSKLPQGAFGAGSTVSVMTAAGASYTEVAPGTPATTQFVVDYVAGTVKFALADVGVSVVITYRYALTVAEARTKFYQRNINNTAGAIFNQIGILTGEGEMYTSEYVTSANWSGASDRNVRTAAGGQVTIGGANAIVGMLIKSPTADDPTVGIKFNLI